jgi:hypothetical protein
MKLISIFLIISHLSLIALTANGVTAQGPLLIKSQANRPARGFAVVELYTSEGCSSCPPADDLIARIQRENNDQPVYFLSFHVDYWNKLGWKDSFSSAIYTKRQNQYADWLNIRSLYTPQVVVNGRKEFVGSDEVALRNAIRSNLQNASSAVVTLKEVQIVKEKVSLKFQTDRTTKHISLVLAFIQKSATTEVKKGENGGRTLSHVQIVRNLQIIDLDQISDGTAHIDQPEGVNAKNSEIIAFLQNNSTGEIIAATKVSLDSSSPMIKIN